MEVDHCWVELDMVEVEPPRQMQGSSSTFKAGPRSPKFKSKRGEMVLNPPSIQGIRPCCVWRVWHFSPWLAFALNLESRLCLLSFVFAFFECAKHCTCWPCSKNLRTAAKTVTCLRPSSQFIGKEQMGKSQFPSQVSQAVIMLFPTFSQAQPPSG